MYLSKENFEFYKNYFVGKNTENIFIYIDDLAKFQGKDKGRVRKELYFYIQDKKEFDLVESRRDFYNKNFFNLDYKSRHTVQELSEMLKIPIQEVNRDLKYFGLMGVEYKKTSDYREMLARRPMYEGYLRRSEYVPSYGQMSKEIGLPAYQIKRELEELGIDKPIYGLDIIEERKNKVKQYFEKELNVAQFSLKKIAEKLNTNSTILKEDMIELGFYDDYFSSRTDFLNERNKEKEAKRIAEENAKIEQQNLLRLRREENEREKARKQAEREKHLKEIAEKKERYALEQELRRNEIRNRIKVRYDFYLANSENGILMISQDCCKKKLGISDTTFWTDLAVLGLRVERKRVENLAFMRRGEYYKKYTVNGKLTISTDTCIDELGVCRNQVYMDLKRLGIKPIGRKGVSRGRRNYSENVQKIEEFSKYIETLLDDDVLTITTNEIVEKFHCPFSTFKYWLQQFGTYEKYKKLKENARH